MDDIKNYHVALTFAEGKWTGHVEGPEGDIQLPTYNAKQCGDYKHVTLTTCLELVRTGILDDHTKR